MFTSLKLNKEKNIMVQIVKYPENVFGQSLKIDGNILSGFCSGPERKWTFKLPSGEWYVKEHNHDKNEIIIYNGLDDLKEPEKIIQWEYKVWKHYAFGAFMDQLDKVGEEGWELITQQEVKNPDAHYQIFNFVFKRRKV